MDTNDVKPPRAGGEGEGSKPREVLISREEYERMKDSLV